MKKVLFLNLTAFSMTGGIERFNRCFLKALNLLDTEKKTDSFCLSAYDTSILEQYTSEKRYKSFGKSKLRFSIESILRAKDYDCIILGHVNLAPIGLAIKKLFPSKKLILITHGIDVWGGISKSKKEIMKRADIILSVSNFTKKKIVDNHKIQEQKIVIFPNAIDPYFPIPKSLNVNNELKKRYKIDDDDFILYTLSRLRSTELYKGYDKVIMALSSVVKTHPNIKYVIAGKYDIAEKERVEGIVKSYGMEGNVILTGFLNEEELVMHYQMADAYIMPSKKEGFGIVFIESLVCGTPVIAGNIDGSVDALLNGEAGTLIDPDDIDEIAAAVVEHIEHNRKADVAERQRIVKKILDNFSFEKYKNRLESLLAVC